MNKLTKVLSVFIIAGAVGASVAGIAGCKKGGHTHKIDINSWTDNLDGTHDGFCSCGHLMVDDEEHPWDDGVCIKCGAIEGAVITTVTGVTVSAAGGATSVAKEGSLQLSATVAGTGSPAQTVTWSSSDNSKATVNTTGLVTGVEEGTVTITATSTVDNTKSGSITLTVTAKGTVDPGPTDKSLYETLLAKDNVRVQIDKQATAGTKLGALDEATAGVYVTGSSGYEAETHVEYAEESGVKVLKQVTTHPGEEGKPNVYTIINPGPVKDEIEGVFSTKTSHVGSAGEFIVFKGDNSVKLALSKSGDNGALTCTYGSDGSVPVTGVTVKVNEYIEVYFKFNLTEGKATIKVNGKTALDNVETGMNVFNYVQLSASNKGQRLHTAKDIVICGAVKTLADSKTEANAIIDAELAKYNAADYTTNGSDLTAAVSTAKQAVEAAQDVAEVNQAVADCKAALKAVLKDSDIAAARTKALDDLKAKYPKATKFTYTGLTGEDAKYNNVSLYDAKIEEVTTALESKNTAAEMKAITDAADTYLATVTDTAMLTAKIAEVKAELASYTATYKTEHCDGDEAKIAAADNAVVAQNTVLEGSTDIADANDNLAEAKLAVAKAVTDVGRDPQEIIDEAKTTIGSYKSTEIAAIEADYAAYKTVIGEAKTAASDGITAANADSEVSKLKNEVDRYLANYAAHKTADAYKTTEANKVKNNDVKTTIEELDFLETFKEVKATETATAAEARAEASTAAQNAVDDIVKSLKTYRVAVTVGENEVCYVTYGTKLTLGDLCVSGFNVSAATLNGKAITENEQDDEDLTVYNPVTVTVTGKSDIAGFKTSETWAVAEGATDVANITENNLYKVTSKDVPNDTSTNTAEYFTLASEKTIAGTSEKFTRTWRSSNVAAGTDSSARPIIVDLKASLSEFVIYLNVSESAGVKINRYGTIYCVKNGDTANKKIVKTLSESGDMSVKYVVDKSVFSEGLNSGDRLEFYLAIPTGGQGSRLFLFKTSATVDTSAIEKTVTVDWQNGDGTVWKTTTHHYFETIAAPTATDSDKPSGTGTLTDWNYNGATLSADLKLASSGTAYVMTPVFAANDITINYTDGTTSEPLNYLSTDTTKELPDAANGDETHLFLGYYLQAGDAPADTDTVFDLSTAAAGTYTVYAKYMEANVHITYVDSIKETSETVHLFLKADGSLVDAEGKVATVIEDPEKPDDGQHLFLGYYLQADAEPADDDVVFDITGVEENEEYNVYAKYMQANVTIIYKESAGDEGTTVYLFKTKDSLLTADGEEATLKAEPTAPADKPEFKGWVYMDGEDEVVLNIADLMAGDTITVTAKFGELSVKEMSFFINDQANAATTYATVAANSKFEENALFDITADTAFEHYKGTDTSRAKFTPNDGKERAMLNGSVIKMSTDIPYNKNNTAEQNSLKFMTIKANAKIELKVYVALSNASWGDNSTGNLTYKIKQADGTYKDTSDTEKYPTGYSFASRGVITVTITLEEGEELELTAGNTGKTSRYIYFGGAEATVVTE